LSVVNDGGIPVAHTTLDGNSGEATTHKESLRRLHEILPRSATRHIGDTKHDTEENLLAIVARGGRFLCGGVFSEELQQRYLRLRGQLHAIAYWPKSQESLPAAQRDKYEAHEVEELLEGEVGGEKVRSRYRLIFIRSEGKAREEAQTRERHVAKIREEFEAIARNLNKYELRERGGQFSLAWHIDGKALAEWQQLEGVFVLKTNLSRSGHPVVVVLRKYKEQSQVERRFHHVKGPLAVAPLFLEKPERMAGLVCIVVWALLVMALMERQVRRKLGGKPLYGLYPENRPSPAPAGPAIVSCFEAVCLVVMRNGSHVSRHLGEFNAIQRKMLSLLGVSDEDLHIFKRRCGM